MTSLNISSYVLGARCLSNSVCKSPGSDLYCAFFTASFLCLFQSLNFSCYPSITLSLNGLSTFAARRNSETTSIWTSSGKRLIWLFSMISISTSAESATTLS